MIRAAFNRLFFHLLTKQFLLVNDKDPIGRSQSVLHNNKRHSFSFNHFCPRRNLRRGLKLSMEGCQDVWMYGWGNFLTLRARRLKFVVGLSNDNLTIKPPYPLIKQSRLANFYNFRPISMKLGMEVTNGGIHLNCTHGIAGSC